MGIGYPEKYGGSGGGAIEQMITFEELARVCAATAVVIIASNELTGHPIYVHGNEEQRQQYLAPLLRGEDVIS